MQRVALGAPVDHARRDRERERGAGPEQGCAGECADCADGDRSVVHLERDRLAEPDEDDERDEPEDVGCGAEAPQDAGADAHERDDTNQSCEPLRQ